MDAEAITPATPPAIIATDRGSFGDSTAIMPVGRVNIEAGFTAAWRERDGRDRRVLNGPESTLRVGLIDDRLELRTLWSGSIDSREDGPAGRVTADGMSDIALGLKLKVLDQDAWIPRTLLIAQSFIGVGNDDVTGDVDPTVKAALSWDLGQGFGVLANAGASWPSDAEGHVAQGLGSLLVSWSAFDETTLFAEYYAVMPISRDDDAAHSIDVGIWQRLGPSVQLDLRVGCGLNDAADDLVIGAGIAFLY